MNFVKIFQYLVFSCILFASVAIKTIGIEDPYFGAHRGRQIHTLSNIDSYFDPGVSFLKVKSNFIPWPSNELYEAPLYQYFVYILSPNVEGNPVIARTVNIVIGLLTSIFVFLIARFLFSDTVALYSLFFFLMSPINILFHPSILPDVLSVLAGVGAFLFLLKIMSGEKSKINLYGYVFCGFLVAFVKALYLFPVALLFILKFLQAIKSGEIKRIVDFFKTNATAIFLTFIVLLAVVAWISITYIHSGGHSQILRHASVFYLEPVKLIKTLFSRILLDLGNPFVALFFIIGVVSIIGKRLLTPENVLLVCIAPIYYTLFPINHPHEYYSIIMVPFFSILSGYGAHRVEMILKSDHVVKDGLIFRVVIISCAAVISTLLFFKDNVFSIFNSSKRFHQIAQTVGRELQQHQYAYLFMNADAQFPDDDPFYKPADFKARITQRKILSKDWNQESSAEIRKSFLADNLAIHRNITMHALGQYGPAMILADKETQDFIHAIRDETYQHYRYFIFYKYKDPSSFESSLKPDCCKLIFHSDDWMVFETKR
ncbi:MAG: glycosyltransferase family 39 protein [Nitrospirae bacterium]|nr:glycosyltransferase family 39 protein [Magnetococcales bacterium]HAT51524.1 hypothetical protein [Alphaproteobacteria bacterium]